MVVPDGSAHMQVESSQSAFAASASDCAVDVNTIQSYSESLEMIHVVSGTSPQFQTLGTHSKSDFINANTPPYSYGDTYAPGDTIPDGQGGVLADWTNQTNNAPLTLADISSNGLVQADFENLYGDLQQDRPIDGDLVLGDNNTAFVTDGYSVTSLRPADLSQNWSYTTTGGTLSFVAATPGSTVAINDSQQGAIGLDSYGNASVADATREGAAPFDLATWQSLLNGELAILFEQDGTGGIRNVLAACHLPRLLATSKPKAPRRPVRSTR